MVSIIQKQLDKHAPIKTRKVKTQRLPEWCTPEIVTARRMRDRSKKLKTGHNIKYCEIVHNILYAKPKKKSFFSESISSQKETRTICKHFRSYTKKTNSPLNTLPGKLKMNDVRYSDSQNIACKLNDYFASVCDHFSSHNDPGDAPDMNKLNEYINS